MNSGTTRVVLNVNQWGRGFLLKNDLMCCLGFACLALGHTKEQILGEYYPTDVGEKRFSVAASDELRVAATELFKFAYSPLRTVQDVLSSVNDNWHRLRSDENVIDSVYLSSQFKDTVTEDDVLRVIRMGFKEVGLQLVVTGRKQRDAAR